MLFSGDAHFVRRTCKQRKTIQYLPNTQISFPYECMYKNISCKLKTHINFRQIM